MNQRRDSRLGRSWRSSVVVAAALAISVIGCSAVAATPPPTTCEAPTPGSTPPLTCAGAIVVALSALPPNHPAMTRLDFRYGSLCVVGQKTCTGPLPKEAFGYVTFWPQDASPPLWVGVHTDDAGVTSLNGTLQPLPSNADLTSP